MVNMGGKNYLNKFKYNRDKFLPVTEMYSGGVLITAVLVKQQGMGINRT